jgi:hypothetical protein
MTLLRCKLSISWVGSERDLALGSNIFQFVVDIHKVDAYHRPTPKRT